MYGQPERLEIIVILPYMFKNASIYWRSASFYQNSGFYISLFLSSNYSIFDLKSSKVITDCVFHYLDFSYEIGDPCQPN